MNNKYKKPDKPHEVGYKKPPRHTRFKKGQSGNPAGRPKGTPNLATALEVALMEKVIVNENGQRRTISKLEAMVTQMVNRAVADDPRARQQLLGVMHVLEGEAAASLTAGTDIEESDRQVMQSAIERIRNMPKGDTNDKSHEE